LATDVFRNLGGQGLAVKDLFGILNIPEAFILLLEKVSIVAC
jgi:hypothetical protein